MKLPKIPIDYNKARTGEAPFDGAPVITHHSKRMKNISYWSDSAWCFISELGSFSIKLDDPQFKPTNYSPMPEFVEQKESE